MVKMYKLKKNVSDKILKEYGFRYVGNGDYRFYMPSYKWNDKTTVYTYFYINLEENVFTYEVKSEGSIYFPYYTEKNSLVNQTIEENINKEIEKLIKRGILKR